VKFVAAQLRPQIVMGYRTYNLAVGLRSDWQRSDVVIDNGWGSAALWDQTSYSIFQFDSPPPPTPTSYPVQIPRIGPCGDGAPTYFTPPPGTPFPFQQNPCTFASWEAISSLGNIAEIEEAATDMFLNWVFWKTQGSAFFDVIWRSSSCYPNGCQDVGLSGLVRSEWMNSTVTTLFNQFGW